MMASKGLLIVRAQVPDEADRAPFDSWYEKEHLPDALAAFRADRAWRSWSKVEPSSHCAFYEFPDVAAALAALESDAIGSLIKEFDGRGVRAWSAPVTSSRWCSGCRRPD